VGVVREVVLSGERLRDNAARVVEPELDMNRFQPQQSTAVSRLKGLVRWLTPGGQSSLVGAPMRSVDRELEEAWPSGRASS
jgi:hypothetical protein